RIRGQSLFGHIIALGSGGVKEVAEKAHNDRRGDRGPRLMRTSGVAVSRWLRQERPRRPAHTRSRVESSFDGVKRRSYDVAGESVAPPFQHPHCTEGVPETRRSHVLELEVGLALV